jgi:hypothetical protein
LNIPRENGLRAGLKFSASGSLDRSAIRKDSGRYLDAHLHYSSAIGGDLVIFGLVCGKDLHAFEESKILMNNNRFFGAILRVI